MTSTNERRVLVHSDRPALAASVAARFLTKTVDILDEADEAHIVLSGGSVNTDVLAAINASPARDTIDWSRVSFWWGDERFVGDGDEERNDTGAFAALLDHIDVPAENIHRWATSDGDLTLEEAARDYAEQLRRAALGDDDHPRFDITFLGVGPDGHIASLFPNLPQIRVTEGTTTSVADSPKPPPARLSLTRPAINSSERIWLVVSGPDKSSALGLALAGASYTEVPVAGAKGRRRTVFFVDRDAAAEVPENLIAPSY